MDSVRDVSRSLFFVRPDLRPFYLIPPPRPGLGVGEGVTVSVRRPVGTGSDGGLG